MKRYSFLIFLLISCIFLFTFSSCASYKYSNKHKDEKLRAQVIDTLPVIEKSDLLAQVSITDASRGEIDILGRVIGYAATGIKKIIELSKKNLTVQYTTGLNNLTFYKAPSTQGVIDPEGMQFNGFTVLRTVRINDEIDTALFLRFVVDTSEKYDIINNSMFRLKLDEIKVNYAKARINGCKWYMPWTVFWAGKKNKKLNMDIEIIITSSWLGENYSINTNVEIGRFMLGLRNLPLDKKDTGYVKIYSELKGEMLDGYSFIVPRSYGKYPDIMHKFNKCWGQGLFNIQVNITEAGKEKFITKVAEKSPAIIEEIESLFKEKYKK